MARADPAAFAIGVTAATIDEINARCGRLSVPNIGREKLESLRGFSNFSSMTRDDSAGWGSYVEEWWSADPTAYGTKPDQIGGSHHAFTPPAIAGHGFTLGVDAVQACDDVAAALAALPRSGSTPGGVHSLAETLMPSKSLASSGIEGLQMSYAQMARVRNGRMARATREDAQPCHRAADRRPPTRTPGPGRQRSDGADQTIRRVRERSVRDSDRTRDHPADPFKPGEALSSMSFRVVAPVSAGSMVGLGRYASCPAGFHSTGHIFAKPGKGSAWSTQWS